MWGFLLVWRQSSSKLLHLKGPGPPTFRVWGVHGRVCCFSFSEGWESLDRGQMIGWSRPGNQYDFAVFCTLDCLNNIGLISEKSKHNEKNPRLLFFVSVKADPVFCHAQFSTLVICQVLGSLDLPSLVINMLLYGAILNLVTSDETRAGDGDNA